MDTGPIYVQTRYAIQPNTTAGELLSELSLLGPAAVEQTIFAIANGRKPVLQNHDEATPAPKLSKAEAQINWNTSAVEVVNKILGFSPNTGATTKFRGEVLRITKAKKSEVALTIGQISLNEGSVLVGTALNSVELLEVTPAGKKSMSAAAWANGARFTAGELLE